MPASTMEPITSVLKSTFRPSASSSSSSTSAVEAGLVASAKKSLLSATVSFDPPVRQIGSNISGVIKKSGLIFLNSKKHVGDGHANEQSEAAKAGNGEHRAEAQTPPKPRYVFFEPESVRVGYQLNRPAGAGMQNLGNTCYLNSTLQALFHTPSLYNYLTSGQHEKQCKIMQNGNNGYIQGACIITAMIATLRDTMRSSVTRPNRIYDRLKTICKHLMHGRQEDAHEFLRYLIEALQRCYLVSAGAPKNLDSASKETTPFNQIFGGYLRQDVTCMQCHHVSVTFQHFMDLLLDIRPVSTIEDALNHYFKSERIGDPSGSGDSMYKCDRCKARVHAKKRSFISRPPIVLCLQLKRFSLFGGKISKPVSLRKVIDVGKHVKRTTPTVADPPPLKYKLVSMITHVGPSPNCGHYTAIGQAGHAGVEQFFQFDDCSVRPVSSEQALNTASYVVIYEMTQDTKRKWVDEGGVDGRDDIMRERTHKNVVANGVSQKPATITRPQIGPQLPAGHPSARKPNGPALIPADGPRKQAVPTLGRSPNAIGVVSKANVQRVLVQYGDSSDSCGEEEDTPATKGANGQPKASTGACQTKSPFVPRAVTMKTMGRAIPSAESKTSQSSSQLSSQLSSSSSSSSAPVSVLLPLHERPSSAVSSSSGSWKVTDADEQSVLSDKSTGSTTNNWRVSSFQEGGESDSSKSPAAPAEAPQRKVIAREAFGSEKTVSSSSSSTTSSPDRRIKRNSSMEEYEADLDRGRPKKVKKRHSNGRPQQAADVGENPFQSQQNRFYHANNANSPWNSNVPYSNGNHRDHSYHTNNGGGGRDGRWSDQGGFRRSQSSPPLNGGGAHDRDRSRDHRRYRGFDRDRFGKGGGGHLGDGYNRDYEYRNNYYRRHGQQNYDRC